MKNTSSFFMKFVICFALTSIGFLKVSAQETATSGQIKIDEKPFKHFDLEKNKMQNDNKPLIVLDGKMINEKKFNKLDQEKIDKIEVFKGKEALSRYGEKAKYGVIVVTTKK